MLGIGAIRPSHSPWACPVVLVKKKHESISFCIDQRKLNSHMVQDSYSLPQIEETLDCLKGTKYFISLDLKSGYWQVEMVEECKPLTAFTVGPLGFYECKQMAFGAINTPETLQRLMETWLGDLQLSWCVIYLDDVVFGATSKEHFIRLRKVFEKLKTAGLKLKPSKWEFFKKSITYLGHLASENEVEADPKKTAALRDWPTPITVTDVRSFLVFINYYRRLIKDYAQVAHPIYPLISGDNASKNNKAVVWTQDCQQAFDKLKDWCTSANTLAYADFNKPLNST